tara:strand:+ start:331 stop:564 length:234 start_codon:yes stop_codon:yes gene_type:complete
MIHPFNKYLNSNIDWNIVHEKVLKGFSITLEKDGSWLICARKTSDKGCDAPMRICHSLNDAIDYAIYFDWEWNIRTD